MKDIEDEASRLTDLLKGKIVKVARRRRPGEFVIRFEDGTRLYVDAKDEGLELSVEALPMRNEISPAYRSV
ncbi:MAG: hypothetical protein AB1586_27650 [Pseudomonadota bacterium]